MRLKERREERTRQQSSAVPAQRGGRSEVESTQDPAEQLLEAGAHAISSAVSADSPATLAATRQQGCE